MPWIRQSEMAARQEQSEDYSGLIPYGGGVTKFAQKDKEVAPMGVSRQDKTLDENATTSRFKHQRAACHFRALCGF